MPRHIAYNWGGLRYVNPSQILQHPDIAGDLKSTAFSVLRRLCGTFGNLPRSCSINEDFKTQEKIPFATRGYTDLWERNWKGKKVAVKGLRFSSDDDKNKIRKVTVSVVYRFQGELTITCRDFVKKWYCGSV